MPFALKIYSLLIFFSVLPIFASCTKSINHSECSDTLYKEGLSVIQTMSELSSSQEYTELYTSSEDIEHIFAKINKGDYTKAVKSIP